MGGATPLPPKPPSGSPGPGVNGGRAVVYGGVTCFGTVSERNVSESGS
jgi:hypothetical protein